MFLSYDFTLQYKIIWFFTVVQNNKRKTFNKKIFDYHCAEHIILQCKSLP